MRKFGRLRRGLQLAESITLFVGARQGDGRYEQHKEQEKPHSITSSARASSIGGIRCTPSSTHVEHCPRSTVQEALQVKVHEAIVGPETQERREGRGRRRIPFLDFCEGFGIAAHRRVRISFLSERLEGTKRLRLTAQDDVADRPA